MAKDQTFLSTFQWFVFDENDNPDQADANSPLAYQDSFIRWIPELNQDIEKDSDNLPYGVLHFYPINYPAVLLGAKDTRIGELEKGNQHLIDSGYTVVQRPHGGLAVVNDPGVLNFGVVSDNAHYQLSIDLGYEEMVTYLRFVLNRYGLKLESYEIPDSYCPGKFDLVVDGKKIGGIAQRRFKTGVATAAYLSINGNQHERAVLIREFYRIGEADDSYPTVNPDSMTTIQDLIDRPITVEQFKKDMLEVIQEHSKTIEGSYSNPELQEIYNKSIDKADKRSQKLI